MSQTVRSESPPPIPSRKSKFFKNPAEQLHQKPTLPSSLQVTPSTHHKHEDVAPPLPRRHNKLFLQSISMESPSLSSRANSEEFINYPMHPPFIKSPSSPMLQFGDSKHTVNCPNLGNSGHAYDIQPPLSDSLCSSSIGKVIGEAGVKNETLDCSYSVSMPQSRKQHTPPGQYIWVQPESCSDKPPPIPSLPRKPWLFQPLSDPIVGPSRCRHSSEGEQLANTKNKVPSYAGPYEYIIPINSPVESLPELPKRQDSLLLIQKSRDSIGSLTSSVSFTEDQTDVAYEPEAVEKGAAEAATTQSLPRVVESCVYATSTKRHTGSKGEAHTDDTRGGQPCQATSRSDEANNNCHTHDVTAPFHTLEPIYDMPLTVPQPIYDMPRPTITHVPETIYDVPHRSHELAPPRVTSLPDQDQDEGVLEDPRGPTEQLEQFPEQRPDLTPEHHAKVRQERVLVLSLACPALPRPTQASPAVCTWGGSVWGDRAAHTPPLPPDCKVRYCLFVCLFVCCWWKLKISEEKEWRKHDSPSFSPHFSFLLIAISSHLHIEVCCFLYLLSQLSI